MRRIRIVMSGMLLLSGLLVGGPVALAASSPVVLELFTSNSCSSCPPAYSLLRKLKSQASADGATPLIVLSEHVDYWNNLGWEDRFSDAQFTRRQSDYAHRVFGRGRVYTPQLVVNGRREMVGSRAGEVRAAIKAETGQANLPVSLNIRSADDSAVDVTVSVAGGAGPGQVWLALTQDDVVSHIGAGENSGRRLVEDGVVRLLKPIGEHPGTADSSRQYHAKLSLPDTVDRGELSIVAFVQQNDSRQIVGAARTGLTDVDRTVSQR